jgi:two-component system, OmpR family, sensor histidine kinase CiaH
MKNILKQSGELGTSLKRNDFKKAVMRLTLYYTAGVFIILTAFSFLIYGLFATRYNVTFYENTRNENREIVVDEIKENLSDILIISDLILLILSIFVSYTISQKTLSPLEDAYQKQKRFIANAAHELRTPLAVLKAGGQVILQKERTLDEYKKFARESLEEADRLIMLSNDLLFLAQNTSRSRQHFEAFSLSEVCTKACDQIILYAKMRSITMQIMIEEGITIIGKKTDIERLVLNLLKNAIDYNVESGSVWVQLVKKGEKAALRVEDSGIGILPHDIPYIFERFYKADTSRTQKKNSGTGLGLAIAKEIVDEHRGTITVQSVFGKGSRFEVLLPLS